MVRYLVGCPEGLPLPDGLAVGLRDGCPGDAKRCEVK